MKSSILLHTKLLVPRLRPDHLPRDRLLRQLKDALGRKLILISAPPGYGKTTLLASFASRAELPVVWYQLDPADNDPKVFLRYTIEGLRRTLPDFGQTSLTVLGEFEAQVEQVLMVLLNEITTSIEDDFLVVLEDYHCIERPEVHAITDFLLDHLPPNMHILISTRVEPPLSVARLRASGDLIELRTRDLCFTTEEIAGLTAHLPLDRKQVQLLEEKTEGWAAGLQLALTTLTQKPQEAADDLVRRFRGSNRYVFDYLAEEVFQQQPSEVRAFLLRSSVLTQMNAEICDTVLGTSTSQELLAYLERQNLFIVNLDPERRWHRYHQLFRDFLLNRLYWESEKEARRLQIAAGDYYARQGLWDLAAEHYLMARSADGLARAIHALGPAYLQSGRVDTLYRYLLGLPSAFLEQEPDFLHYQGHVLRYQGQVEEAVSCFEQACTLYRERGKLAKVCSALTQLASMARSGGHYRKAQRLARSAVAEAADEDHAERAEALMTMAKTTGFLEGMARGYKLGEAAMSEARLAGSALSPSARARLLRSQAQLAWWYGDPFACVTYCRAALAAEDNEVSPLACRIDTIRATPHLYWRNAALAYRFAKRGVELGEQLQFTEWLPMAYATLGNVLSRQGELDAAEKHLRRAIAISRKRGVESYAGLMASGYLAFNLVQQGRLVEARQTGEEALHLYAGSPETYELCVCRSVLGDVLIDMGALNTAMEYFLDLRRSCESRQFRLPLAMVYFALGYLHLHADRREAALELIRRSMGIVRHANAVQLYVDQGQRAVTVCRAAQKAGIYQAFAERIISALTPAQEIAPRSIRPAPLPATETDTQDSAIEAITLGDFRLLYNDQEIGRELGLTAKPKELLAYFITHRHQRLPLDRVLEDLWPESRPSRGQASFHTTMHRLRRALTKVAGPADYISYESGGYQLERERFHIDAELFDASIARAQLTTDEEAIRAYEMAIDLYGGPFLPSLYYDWSEGVRRRLSVACLTALRFLVAHYAAAGDYHQAIAACERMLEIDPLLEQTHCDLMRFWHGLGNRVAVVKQYKTLKEILAEEMSMEPMPETQALYAELA